MIRTTARDQRRRTSSDHQPRGRAGRRSVTGGRPPGRRGGRRRAPGWLGAGGTGRRTPAAAAPAGSRSAAANAAPSAYRSVGSLASARRTTAARSAGTSAGRAGTGSRRWASAVATGVSATNGPVPGEALEGHHAERVDVGGGGRGARPGPARGRGTAGCPSPGRSAVSAEALGGAGDAEVGDLDLPVGGDQQVGGLHVAVHDAGARGRRRARRPAWASRSRAASGSSGWPARSSAESGWPSTSSITRYGRGGRSRRRAGARSPKS